MMMIHTKALKTHPLLTTHVRSVHSILLRSGSVPGVCVLAHALRVPRSCIVEARRVRRTASMPFTRKVLAS